MRNGVRGQLRGVQPFLVQSFAEPLQTLVQRGALIRFAQRKLNGGDGGGITRRRNKPKNEDAIKKEWPQHDKAPRKTACYGNRRSPNIGVISGTVQSVDAVGDFRAI